MSLDLQKGGTGDLTLRFDFPPSLEASIRADLSTKGRSTPTFTYGFYLQDGTLCTAVTNTVAIRTKGYIGATSPPAESEFKTGVVGRVEEAVRGKVLGGLRKDDGSMDREGFRRAVEGMDMGWTKEQVEELFDALDKDGKGRIDIDEIGGKGWFK
jgi:hypothetical protein